MPKLHYNLAAITAVNKRAVILLFAFLTPALASETGFYIQSSAGLAGLSNSHNNTANAAIQYERGLQAALEMGFLANISTNIAVRFGQEGVYLTNDLSKSIIDKSTTIATGQLSTLGGMFNAYLDAWPNNISSLYVGAGIGFGIVELKSSDLERIQDDSTVIYQLKTGVTFTPWTNTALFAGYRYLHTSGFNTELSKYEAPRYHIGEIGLRFVFL